MLNELLPLLGVFILLVSFSALFFMGLQIMAPGDRGTQQEFDTTKKAATPFDPIMNCARCRWESSSKYYNMPCVRCKRNTSQPPSPKIAADFYIQLYYGQALPESTTDFKEGLTK